jgi:uncharacterized protein (DUF1800 family)
MAPYTGPWTKDIAAHLLRRTIFGPTNQQILDAVTNGMNATVTSILQIPAIGDPLAYHPNETIAPFGTTWVNSVYPSDLIQAQSVENARIMSLGGWIMERINKEQLTIAEKMCLFWQNHFAATAVSDSRCTYDYHMLIRQHALGNFRQFVKDMTINPCMLLFLNGATNNVFSPNENYARELLELFTIGKGPQAGPGDYTNYTEDDVAAAAKILTGYYVSGLRSDVETGVTAVYNSILHDSSTKTMSYRFGNAVIFDNGANEYEDLIDVIFQQDECAYFICRKLYRYFVNYDITSAVETNVITEMANELLANNYDVLPVLDMLFRSEHFYDISVRGAIIRSPMDSYFAMFNSTETQANYDLATDMEMMLNIYWLAEASGQAYATPPAVAGWPAYYQEPSYYKMWVNSTTLKLRFDAGTFVTILTGIPVNGEFYKVNALGFLDNLSAPDDPVEVINDIADVFCPKGLSSNQKLLLKVILTGGLPDSEWTIQYYEYVADPTNPAVSDPVRLKVEQVLYRIFQMPEFHVM